MPRISTDNYDTVASWNGSQDLFVVEQPDGTKVATPAMVKQYVLGNAIDDVYSVMGQMGAKNLFNSQYSVPRTNIGTTSTLGDYGHIIINGTANADGAQLNQSFKGILPIYDLKVGDKLILSYKVISGTFTHGSSSSKTVLYINDKNGNSIQPSIKFPSSLSTGDSGSEEIILDNNCFDNGVFKSKDLQLYIRNGNTFNNLELAIMVRLASDTDETYQPYAKTNKQLTESNRQLTEVIGDLSQTGLTGDTVADQLKSIKNVITFDKVPDSFITLQSGISIVTNQVYKQGNHIFGWITFGFSAQTPSALKLGVLNSGYRPSGISRMMVGLGTQPWTSEYAGYCLRDSDYSLSVTGYNASIRAAHIHLDYVI